MKQTIRLDENTLLKLIKESIDEMAQNENQSNLKNYLHNVYMDKVVRLEDMLKVYQNADEVITNAIDYIIFSYGQYGLKLEITNFKHQPDRLSLDVHVSLTSTAQQFMFDHDETLEELADVIASDIAVEQHFRNEFGLYIEDLSIGNVTNDSMRLDIDLYEFEI